MYKENKRGKKNHFWAFLGLNLISYSGSQRQKKNNKTDDLTLTLPFESVVVCSRNSGYLSASVLKSGRVSR